MKKRKIQIAVISLLAVLTFGGAFLNNKYAHVAPSKTNETQIEKKENKKDKKTEPKKIAKEKTATTSSEKKQESHKESSKEANSEKKIANKDSEKAVADSIETSIDSQKKAVNPEANNASGNAPAAEQKEESAAPATPSQPEVNQPTPENKPTPEPKKEVTFSIKGTVANSSAYFISPQKVAVKDGQSVMDILSDYCRTNGIQVGIRGGTYVAGINNLYEFDKGAESGWLYRVNGAFPSYGAAEYSLQVGDTIEWMYTENMGKDVGAPQV